MSCLCLQNQTCHHLSPSPVPSSDAHWSQCFSVNLNDPNVIRVILTTGPTALQWLSPDPMSLWWRSPTPVFCFDPRQPHSLAVTLTSSAVLRRPLLGPNVLRWPSPAPVSLQWPSPALVSCGDPNWPHSLAMTLTGLSVFRVTLTNPTDLLWPSPAPLFFGDPYLAPMSCNETSPAPVYCHDPHQPQCFTVTLTWPQSLEVILSFVFVVVTFTKPTVLWWPSLTPLSSGWPLSVLSSDPHQLFYLAVTLIGPSVFR